MEKITIEFSEEKYWTVKMGNRKAEYLGWEEVLGVFTSLTIPEGKPCLQWMKTREQDLAYKKYMREEEIDKLFEP